MDNDALQYVTIYGEVMDLMYNVVVNTLLHCTFLSLIYMTMFTTVSFVGKQ